MSKLKLSGWIRFCRRCKEFKECYCKGSIYCKDCVNAHAKKINRYNSIVARFKIGNEA